MEFKAIPTLILTFILVGMVLGVGILTLDKFGTASATTPTITGEEITWDANAETIQLANQNLSVLTQIYNATNNVVDPTNYSVVLATGVITINDQITCAEAETCYATYTYTKYDTVTDSAVDSVNTELTNISTSWLGLIITIVVMSIILGMVLSSFLTRKMN